MDTAKSEIQEFSQINQVVSPKETLKAESWEAAFGTNPTFELPHFKTAVSGLDSFFTAATNTRTSILSLIQINTR